MSVNINMVAMRLTLKSLMTTKHLLQLIKAAFKLTIDQSDAKTIAEERCNI